MLRLLLFGASSLLAAAVSAEDSVEFLTGSTVTGRVVEIRKDRREFDIEVKIGGRTFVRTYPYNRVHAVTLNGKRYVLNERPGGAGGSHVAPSSGNPGGTAESAVRIERSREEVVKLIETVGRTPPDWFDSVPLNYPRTLDLSWPNPGKKEWNSRKYIGQYVWEVINPNRSKWREGIKFLHHVVAVNENKRSAQRKALNQLGTLYCSLMEDWPRAAFWWRLAGSGTSGGMGQGGYRVGYEVGLAKCYWELGNREMAVEMLKRVARFNTGAAHLWAEMGEHDRALQMAERQAQKYPGAYITCGDICRHAGRYEEAIDFYKKASGLDREKYARAVYDSRDRILALQATQSLDLTRIRDGVYTGTSFAYAGPLEVAVTVQDHRITAVNVTRHEEKQYYSSLTDIPNQIIAKQSVQGIDATSSATITAEAIISAAAKALAEATR
jgi:uncharacterized protein with FMN-binding domain